MTRHLTVLLSFLFIIGFAQCANILLVYPMSSYSHFTPGFTIAKALLAKGHQVTMINPYPQKTPIKNFTDVSVEDNVAFVEGLRKHLFDRDNKSPFENVNFVLNMGIELTKRTFQNKNVQELMNSGQKFDVVLVEHFLDEALLGLGLHFNAPVILVSPGASGIINNHLFGNPAPSSYVPSIVAASTKHMNFLERLKNFLFNIMGDLMREFLYMPRHREIFKKYIKTDLELDDVVYNVSLMFTNSHVSFNDAVPHVPSIIEIGGFHVNPPKPLPEDLQKFLDDAKEGVVLFSMGSNLKSKDLTPEVREAVLKAFGKIKQQVLWKFEADFPDLPKNVKIMKWVPQQDVLGHPNVKAFISHGGLLSTIESVYNGVPVIGIPVFGDQKSNIASAVNNGYALNIPLAELNEEKLSWALNEILSNPKYSENVKQRSRVMKDQPLKPIDAAVYWIEHVIRHKGAPHLRSAALDLKWYQQHMIDIIIFLTLVTVVLFIIFYIIIKKMLGICFKRTPPVNKSKKNK